MQLDNKYVASHFILFLTYLNTKSGVNLVEGANSSPYDGNVQPKSTQHNAALSIEPHQDQLSALA